MGVSKSAISQLCICFRESARPAELQRKLDLIQILVEQEGDLEMLNV